MAEDATVLALRGETRRIVAVDVNLSGSEFVDVALREAVFRDVNLSGSVIEDARLVGVRIRDADLTGCAIVESRVEGMTIDGVSVGELFAAWRAAK